ncbi:ROK family glucokinase [Ectobacillus sp. sgz5001026]|uniref:ROK family glucokinase n=1 Tax=Ectobacillus sp. sgz5001026 TaxID=3242473 RepID=UPI0036D361AA
MNEKWIVGVDLGATTIKLAFITYQGDLLCKWEIPTNLSDNGIYIPTEIAKAIEMKLAEMGESKSKLAGIGIGAPGPVNLETGIVYEAINIGWRNYPLMQLMQEETGLLVSVDNDANVASLGEMWKGAGAGASDIVCVTLGTGVGGGVITNGELVHGISGAAGEIGHITVIPENGALCNCGKTGCLETIASATGIVRLAKEALQSSNDSSVLRDVMRSTGTITAKDVFDAAKTDAIAMAVVKTMAYHLGLTIANMANILNPEKIVIGGGVSHAGEFLLSLVQEQFTRFAFPRVAKSTKLAIATLGNDAGVVGSAWLVIKKIGKG